MTFDPINLLISIPAAERAAAWKGRRLTVQGSGFKPGRRPEEPATRALRRQIARAEAALDAVKREERRARAQELRERRALRKERRA